MSGVGRLLRAALQGGFNRSTQHVGVKRRRNDWSDPQADVALGGFRIVLKPRGSREQSLRRVRNRSATAPKQSFCLTERGAAWEWRRPSWSSKYCANRAVGVLPPSLVAKVPALADIADRGGGDLLEADGVAEAGHPPVQTGAVGALRRRQGDRNDGSACAHVAMLMNETSDFNLDVLG